MGHKQLVLISQVKTKLGNLTNKKYKQRQSTKKYKEYIKNTLYYIIGIK